MQIALKRQVITGDSRLRAAQRDEAGGGTAGSDVEGRGAGERVAGRNEGRRRPLSVCLSVGAQGCAVHHTGRMETQPRPQTEQQQRQRLVCLWGIFKCSASICFKPSSGDYTHRSDVSTRAVSDYADY